jgi:hypothetical protein
MVWKAIGNTSLPIAPVQQEWNREEARKRIFCWAGWDNSTPSSRTWKAFFALDEDHRQQRNAYRLAFTDVINGELVAVPRAIDAIARSLASGQNELELPADVVENIRRKISLYYRKMDAIPPWVQQGSRLLTAGPHFTSDHKPG